VEQARQAVHKLRQYGYKMSLHMMPGLYGSDYDKDIDSFRQLYDDPYFRPDEIKFYPTSVIPNTELYELYLKGEYKPLETAVIQQLIREVLLDIIPPYTRIKRLIRDIPSTEIVAGSSVTNLSQLTHDQMKKELKDTPVMQ
jgi:elongator complex protein 3